VALPSPDRLNDVACNPYSGRKVKFKRKSTKKERDMLGALINCSDDIINQQKRY
jgi:hypothetical protein